MKQKFKRFFWFVAQAITIIFTALTLVLVIISFARPEWIKDGVRWIGELIQSIGNWNYLIAFASACIESLPIIGTAVPGMNIMILVGGFWGKTHLIGTVTLAILWAMLGNYLGYWMGKWYGIEIIDKYGDYFGLGRTETKILHKQLEKNGFWYIVLGKFHNFTRAFIPFIAGSSGMSEKNFWLYNMVWSIFWAISINLLGILFIDNYETVLDNFGKISTGIIVIVIAYIYFFKREWWNRYMQDKQREILEKSAKSQTK
jgi:membrane-associated protein